jgi:hypothetical protein
MMNKTFCQLLLIPASSCHITLATAMALLFAMVPLVAQTEDSAFVAHLDFSKGLAGETSGNVRLESLETEMGGHLDRYQAATFAGKNTSLAFKVPAPAKGEDLLLEIREIHNRRPGVFGYTVLVDGREVYFRTYEEYGAGPNHFFVQVPAQSLAASEKVRVELRSESATPFSIADIWAYHDFANKVAKRESVNRPMALHGLKLPKDGKKPRFNSFSPLGTLSIASYGSRDPESGRDTLIKNLNTDAAVGEMSVWLINGTAWGGKPNGPDGLGCYFSDPRYSLLNYDAANARFIPSWPGMWSNTAWPTLRDETMNAFLETRFQRMMAGHTEAIDRLKAQGLAPNLVIVREWGPAIGEISNTAIEDARRDGINLDPSNGLDPEARLWMHRDGVRLWKDFAASTRRAVERDSVLVDNGNVVLPDTQLLDHLYSQPDFLTDWPMEDLRWSAGQPGMVPGLWSSGEMGKGTEYRELAMYDYLRARGRLAMVNMERTILKDDFSVLKDHYARGFQFMTLFNTYDGDEKLVEAVDRCDSEPALPAVHREPSLLALDFPRQKKFGPEGAVVSKQNVTIEHAKTFRAGEHGAPRLAVVDSAKPGEITYRIENPDTFTAALNLHLQGRISTVKGNRIEIFAGESPGTLSKIKTLTADDLPTPKRWTPHVTSETTIDLGHAMIGKTEYYIRFVLHSPSSRDAAFLMKIAVGSQWARKSGYVSGQPLKRQDQRIQNLWVQDRAIAENMLGQFTEASGGEADKSAHRAKIQKQAEDLISRGWYRSAYRLLAGEISQILPARYVVRGGGTLGCWPVEVAMPSEKDSVVVRLLSVAPEKVSFSLKADQVGQKVALAFPGLDPSKKWTLKTTGVNSYEILPAKDTDLLLVVEKGKGGITIGLDPVPTAPKQALPRHIVGRVLGWNKARISIDTQNMELMNNNDSIAIPLSKNVKVSRKADQLTDPKAGTAPDKLDHVALELDEKGEVISVDARYGRDRGRIKEFHAPVLIGDLAVGGITLENGRRYDFNYDKTHGTRFATVALNNLILNYELTHLAEGLKPGTEVEIAYTPAMKEGRAPRLFLVNQPTRVLLDEDYTLANDDAWRKKTTSIDRVDVINHRPEPNYLHNVVIRLLRPTTWFQPGSVVYQVKSETPLGDTALEFNARAFEDSSRVEFFTSLDGKKWTKVGQFDNTWQNNIPQSPNSKTWKFPPQTVDLTPSVKGLKDFYLKISLTTGDADDRFCFGGFRVLSADTTLTKN